MERNGGKNNKQEKLSLHLKFKKCKILFRYHAKGIVRRFNLAYVLFMLSIALFFLILVPNMIHRFPLPSERWPYVFELHGTVLTKANDNNQTTTPVSFAVVEIGGYRTTTDVNGNFYIKFISQTETDIPILITLGNKTRIQRVSFERCFERTAVLTVE